MPPIPPLNFSGSSSASSGGDFVGGSINFYKPDQGAAGNSFLLGAAFVAVGVFVAYKMVK